VAFAGSQRFYLGSGPRGRPDVGIEVGRQGKQPLGSAEASAFWTLGLPYSTLLN
jgi:hypothetical protein